MKIRIAAWTGAGALVVIFWALYISATFSNPRGFVLTLLCITCPIALFRQPPQTFYFVLLVNAATYALLGLVVETIRRQHQTRMMAH